MAAKRGYQKLVKAHYRKEAKEQGISLSATMHDATTRRLEIQTLLSYLKTGDKALEIGCGNGAASVEIGHAKKLSMTCVDFSPDLISIAKKQSTKDVKGSISFREQDVLHLSEKPTYDVVFTERCIINLLDWNDQKEALLKMIAALKRGGKLLLLEAFQDGLRDLNRARTEVGLTENPPAYHNLLLDKEKVRTHLEKNGMKFSEENNFLSSYYFGSRVLYPALAKLAKKDIVYNNAFGQYFASLPPTGNFSHIKLLAFTKK